MAINFYLLEVADIVKETEEAVSVVFKIPEDLKETFQFKHGQYVTVKVPIDGDENRRAYSISSSPYEGILRIGVKKVDGGKVSVFINENLKIGDKIEVMPPMGNFTVELDENNTKEYIFFGAGSGITPLLSIIKSILKKEPKSNIRLLYSNKYENTIMYKSEIEALREEYNNRFKIVHILSREEGWSGLKGRINSEICKIFVDENVTCDLPDAEYFLDLTNLLLYLEYEQF
jgi:ring-1,2-phenylacetyl-CoA epoxidase subunit PaaE